MPSSPQTVTTRNVFDYLKTPANKAIVGATVNCTLNFNAASVTSPIVNLGEVQQSTTTDQNGFWQFAVTPNDTITPSGTLYTISTPNSSYEISVPSGVADVQSSSILANTPSVLSPALTNLTGPITVTGNETVTGNLSVSGTTTLGSTTAGATTLGATTVGGDLTVGSAFRLLINTAVSKLVPGATSFSVRNNADNADNLLVTNAGAVTVANGLTVTAGGETVTAGDLVVTAGRLLISAAAAKILGGATSLSLRNTADSADNVLVTDAGLVTLRNALSIPPAAGGTLPPTGYGTVVNKVDEQTPSGGTAITINLPAGGRHAEIEWTIRDNSANGSDVLQMTFNSDTGTNYDYGVAGLAAGAWTTPAPATTVAFIRAGVAAGGTTGAGIANKGIIEIFDYTETSFRKLVLTRCSRNDGTVFGLDLTHGDWHPVTPVAITSVTLTLAAGAFVAGSRITTRVKP